HARPTGKGNKSVFLMVSDGEFDAHSAPPGGCLNLYGVYVRNFCRRRPYLWPPFSHDIFDFGAIGSWIFSHSTSSKPREDLGHVHSDSGVYTEQIRKIETSEFVSVPPSKNKCRGPA
uniref:hypothetical protein n=1 Tax=Brucella endophytica TaxID=1963359 RepID=UPI0035BC19CE